jgi:hypothetical protein
MRIIILLFLSFGVLTGSNALAQQLYSISGTIKDNKGETLPGANVLLSGYQKGAVADNQGKYTIAQLKPGNYDVLVQMIGFLPANVNVIVNDKSVVVDITMKESVNQLKEVVIRTDPYRQRWLEIFKANFIGTSPNAAKSKIINPDVIRFDYDKDTRTLNAAADEFIIVENKALGYRIRYLLKYFEKNDKLNLVMYYGYPSFEDLATSKSKQRQYKRKRDEAYLGSPQHFFAALFDNTSKPRGFIINKMLSKPNPKKLPDSVLNEKIKLFSQIAVRGANITANSKDSLAYYNRIKREPDSVDVLSRVEVMTDTLVKREVSNLRWIDFTDKLYVIYTAEKESKEYNKQSSYKVNRPMDLASSQVSVIHQLKTPIAFYQNGLVFDPSSLLFEGYWGYEKVADMVPMDYFTSTSP